MPSNFIMQADGQEYRLYGMGLRDNRFCIPTVAHSLAQLNRFVGHARRPYSVAEHSLLCADIAEQMEQPAHIVFACLLHDGHEAATGDCSSPAKAAIGTAWADFEGGHATAFRRQYGINGYFGPASIVHRIDLIALATERRDLLPWSAESSTPWAVLDTPGHEVLPHDGFNLRSLAREHTDWTEWMEQFQQRYEQLRVARDAALKRMVRHQPA